MYKLIDCKQGSDEWFYSRLGRITASNFSKTTTPKGAVSSSHTELVHKAVAELVVGNPLDTFQSEAMKRGNELEVEALEYVNLVYDHSFVPCGFMDAVNEKGEECGYGCSPDAIEEKTKLGLEMKCPMIHTHLAYLSAGVLPREYILQVQGSLLVSGFDKWIFVSYHPGLPALYLVVERDEELIRSLKKNLDFCAKEVKESLFRLNQLLEVA